MALVYPLEMPDFMLRAVRFRFHAEPLGSMSRTAGGAVVFQEQLGGSLWEMSLQTKLLNETDWSRARAWWLGLRGGAKTFKAYDIRRCYPLAYGPNLPALRHSGAAFNGTCTVTAAGGATISLSGLPSTYKLSIGDYISFPWRGSQALVCALEEKVASAGVISAVEVSPWLLAGGATGVTATLVRAWTTMKPKPGSWSGDRSNRDPISFEAIQA